MDVTFRVHRVSTHPVEVEVAYAGQSARAMLPELEVEMYDPNSSHGTLTLHFRSQAEIAQAKMLFKQGGMAKLSFEDATPPEVISTDTDPVAEPEVAAPAA